MNFDYIIIGAGSAGCVLANRLSASGNHRLLLLEAGGPDKKQEVQIPAAFSKLFKSEVDWAYETEPQPNMNGRKLFWPRGKMLGGTSSINAMIYQRGHPSDYDGWAQQGNEEWGWEDVVPYFKKAQNQERAGMAMHGKGGPLNVADHRTVNPISHAFVQAGLEAGFAKNDDFNDGEQEGVGLYQVTQKKGQRHSTAKAYLVPALKRKNLSAETHALAHKLLFEGKQCVGVSYQQNGQMLEARANLEVILCGGAINSPQLLMLSGIGNGNHLQEHGIETVMDLPGVGENLHDHPVITMTWVASQKISLEGAESIGNLLRFLLRKRGPLTSNVGEAGGFVKLNPDSPAPEMQFHFAPGHFIDHGFHTPDSHGFTIGPTLVKVASRGNITLKSADPTAYPAIQPNYFAEAIDMQNMIAGMRIARKIANSKALDPYRSKAYTPDDSVQTDEDMAAYVRDMAQTLYHPVGTCKMGVDPMAVVNPQLQVHGVQGLRVVDASIMPTIVNANTNAPTIMIAEKAADMILG